MEKKIREEGVRKIYVERFLDHLTETLAIELFAAETYPQYAQQARDTEIRRKLKEFGADSDRHRAMVSDLIAELGGRPSMMKELAAATLAWGKGFIDLRRRGRLGTLRNLEDLLLVEYRDRSSWEVVKAVGEATGDRRIIDAADKVLPDEEKHVNWLHERVIDLVRETMVAVHLEIK